MFRKEAWKRAPDVCQYLGFYGLDADENYYFTRKGDSNIKKGGYSLASLDEKLFRKLCPESVWLQHFGCDKKSDDGSITKVMNKTAWDSVRNWIIEEFRFEHYPEPFDPMRVAGSGCWIDLGKPVIHLGKHLVINGGQIIELGVYDNEGNSERKE